MADPSIHAAIAAAIPVVVGGLLAALAGVATQFLTHHLATKREERTARSERLERLVKALFAHNQWVNDHFNTEIFGDGNHDTPSPLDEAHMIQELYFPELVKEMLAISGYEQPMLKFIVEQKLARMTDQEAWRKNWSPKQYYELYTPYRLAVGLTTKKCQKLIK
jgi:hypothetical protein